MTAISRSAVSRIFSVFSLDVLDVEDCEARLGWRLRILTAAILPVRK